MHHRDMSGVVVFLTDFGLKDGYAGIMHGVVSRLSPRTKTLDLSHNISPGNIAEAALILSCSVDHFPEGTVFCCVVDPGVGSHRKPIVIYDDRFYYVGPNNGLFTLIISRIKRMEQSIRIIENTGLMATVVDPTFHGRDIFSPISAFLSSGGGFGEVGPRLDLASFVSLDIFDKPILYENNIRLRIIHSDRFGNLLLNIKRSDIHPDCLSESRIQNWQLKTAMRTIVGLKRTFTDSPIGEPLLYFGSCGYLEIAVNQGDASIDLKLVVGDTVELSF